MSAKPLDNHGRNGPGVSSTAGSDVTPAPSAQTATVVIEHDPQVMVLIVIGAHLRAEIADRPLGYRLREQILHWQDLQDQNNGDAADDDDLRLKPVVCSDVWYLNAAELQDRPVVSIGDPSVNAASAMISTRIPTAIVIENTLRVHLDQEFLDLRACLWGATQSATASAVDVFVERYLDAFLKATRGE